MVGPREHLRKCTVYSHLFRDIYLNKHTKYDTTYNDRIYVSTCNNQLPVYDSWYTYYEHINT
jgi:hypothetical protein